MRVYPVMTPRSSNMPSLKSATRRKAAPAVPSQRVPAPSLGFALSAADLGYAQVVHDSWRACLRELPAGARFLDIAPGIGSVALVAVLSRGRSHEVNDLRRTCDALVNRRAKTQRGSSATP